MTKKQSERSVPWNNYLLQKMWWEIYIDITHKCDPSKFSCDGLFNYGLSGCLPWDYADRQVDATKLLFVCVCCPQRPINIDIPCLYELSLNGLAYQVSIMVNAVLSNCKKRDITWFSNIRFHLIWNKEHQSIDISMHALLIY